MALTILSNFSYNGKNPNFDRDTVATVEDLKAVKPANQEYDYGHIVFCVEDGKHYRFMHKYGAPDEANYNDTTGWFQELATGGSGGSIDTSNFATISDLASKQDVIGDLATIRSGAANGATAVQTVRINNEPYTQPESGKLTLQFKTINNQQITGIGNIEINSGSSGGGIISESDPIFKASPAAGIKSSDIAAWNNKSNFSGNYNDLSNKPTIPSAVTESTVSGWGFTKNKGTVTSVKINGVTKSPNSSGVVDLGSIESGGGTTVINGVTDVTVGGATVVSDNVATIPLASTSSVGVVQLSNDVDSDSETKAASSAAVKTVNDKVNGKQDAISDIEEIRTNASNAFKGTINGETTGDLDVVTSVNGVSPKSGAVTIDVGDKNVQSDWNATSGDAFIKNKPTIPAAVTESTVSDWGFTKNAGTYSKPDGGIPATDLANDVQEKINKVDKAFTGSVNGSKDGGFFTVEKIVMNNNDYKRNGSETHIDLGTVLTEHQDISGKLDKSEAASTYATKEALSEGLANKANIADIPDAVTEDTVSGWGFTKNTGNYSKPTGGIPFGDLDSNVQTILGKANMAVDRIVMNGDAYKPSGSETGINVGTVITEVSANNTVLTPEKGKVKIPAASTNKYGVTTLLTSTSSSSEDKAATPKAVKAAYDLANGKQDKLVSGTNIKTINNQSILGDGNIVANAYPLVNHGTSDTTFTLTPNVFHVWDNVEALTLTFETAVSGVTNEYLFQFSCLGGQVTTLGLPSGIQWANGEVPTLEVMKTYQVSILNNCATIQSFG